VRVTPDDDAMRRESRAFAQAPARRRRAGTPAFNEP